MAKKKQFTAEELKARYRTQVADAKRNILASSLAILELRTLTADQKRKRKEADASVVAFARHTAVACPGGFLKVAPAAKMAGILEEMQAAVLTGGRYSISMPRGFGKSSYCKILVAWLLATGRKKFAQVIAANQKKAESIVRDIIRFFSRSPGIEALFPEIYQPLDKMEGRPTRAPSITVAGEPTDIKISLDEVHLPTVEGYPSSGAILQACGFKSAIRGSVSGAYRPDIFLLDDIQTTELASSEERVQDAYELISADILGSAGHTDEVTALMTSTPIRDGDLTYLIEESGAWRCRKFPICDRLPKCFGSKTEGEDMWAEYARIRQREAVTGGDRDGKCAAYYKAHRDAMDAGCTPLNETAYAPAEISAIQHLMNLRIDLGADAFASEYMQAPKKRKYTFELTPRMVLSRVLKGTKMGYKPQGTVFTACATDINPSYALSSVICHFDLQRSCFVTAYFVSPCHISDAVNDTEFESKIYAAVAEHGRAIRDLGIEINAWGVDAGGKQFSPVCRFALNSQNLCGMPCIPMTGRAGRNFNPNVRTRIRNAINDTVYCKDQFGRVWLAHNVDSIKESMQRAWGTETGAPGGCTLYDGGINHIEFATQVANEKLVGKQQLLAGQVEYLWKSKDPHDLSDTMEMAYALAASRNIVGDMAPAKVAAEQADGPKVVEFAGRLAEADDGDEIEVGLDY